jgi:hypothetical protein
MIISLFPFLFCKKWNFFISDIMWGVIIKKMTKILLKFGKNHKMKRLIFVSVFFIVLFVVSACRKTGSDTIAYGSSINYSNISSSQTNLGGAFSFTKITISPNPVKIGTASKLIATATGNNLSYVWTTSHGDLFGKGATIYYSDSCIGVYSVTCVVSDGTHQATITIPITISN